MPPAKARRVAHFLPDDFTAVQTEYFSELKETQRIDADPSGWLFLQPEALRHAVVPRIREADLGQYYVDEGSGFIGGYKRPLAELLSLWEGRHIDPSEFTVCPSGTVASLVVLSTLKALGISRVLFETPTYYAVVEQVTLLEMAYDLVPTYRRDDYALTLLSEYYRRTGSRFTLWLTQPRFALGVNQDVETVASMLDATKNKNGYVVIDEVMDQTYPAWLAPLRRDPHASRLIRIRSFMKPLGLNGIRLAVILHPTRLRKPIVNALEMMGGAVDVFSLRAVVALSDDVPRFCTMLRAANRQARVLCERAERVVRGSSLSVNPLVNGYVGSVVADLSRMGRSQRVRRRTLLEGCRLVRTPIVPGASFYMAVDPPTEAIRLNFLSEPGNILKGLNNILSLWRTKAGP